VIQWLLLKMEPTYRDSHREYQGLAYSDFSGPKVKHRTASASPTFWYTFLNLLANFQLSILSMWWHQFIWYSTILSRKLNMLTKYNLRFSRRWQWGWLSSGYGDHRPDDGGSTDLWNVGKLIPVYTALQPRRQPSSNMLTSCLTAWFWYEGAKG
jgi:hypothetical protein